MTRQGELQFENLKNEAEAFNTEWKKKVEDQLRAREEGVALIWRGRSVSLTNKEIGADSTFVLTTAGTIGKQRHHAAVES